MNRPTAIPQHVWDRLTEEARAVVGAVIDGLERQIIELRQQVQDLKCRLDQNSTNSSRPPSTDPIGVKRKPPAPPSRKRRGGQKGHPRRMRALVPPERVASVTACKPTACRRYGHALSGEDAQPRGTRSPNCRPPSRRSMSTGCTGSCAPTARPSPVGHCPSAYRARRSAPGCTRPSACSAGRSG
jgi:hypothetical protein